MTDVTGVLARCDDSRDLNQLVCEAKLAAELRG
jgi:hypothetical protein